jgi:hypothetical protein
MEANVWHGQTFASSERPEDAQESVKRLIFQDDASMELSTD